MFGLKSQFVQTSATHTDRILIPKYLEPEGRKAWWKKYNLESQGDPSVNSALATFLLSEFREFA